MTEKTQTFFEKNAVMIKVAAIGFLTLILLIPMAMIQELVMERRARQKEATNEISSKWGYEQRLTGPILVVPYKTFEYDKDTKKTIEIGHLAYFLPEELKVDGSLTPEIRNRGIFDVAVYSSNLKVEGFFKSPKIETAESIQIDWNGAFLTIGISDLRGIKEAINFKWNDKDMACEPGVKISHIVKSGVTVNNPLQQNTEVGEYRFSFNIALNGSRSVSFVPVGRETNVHIESPWGNPSFEGAFLPFDRTITESSFNASWKVLELNRNYPQKWIDSDLDLDESAFGVALLLPVETYQITERSMKYAILFIALTFTVFFFVEVMRKLRVHPIQYVLVGFGLVLFYLLLLSLSEQMSFGLAYIIASFGILVMITTYAHSIFKNNRLTVILAGILVLLYGFLYILLQLQDYALLMGSVGLFIILATVMYLSRKINWYALGGGKSEEE
ncbi:MAG: cell envelope integrity protein CreD [Bacteroidales bacterium]|nr:MAG: cell envelope integrity protein CreD [Bacteroidales bacterium]